MAGHHSNPYSSSLKTTSWYPGNRGASIGVPLGYQRAAGNARNALEPRETPRSDAASARGGGTVVRFARRISLGGTFAETAPEIGPSEGFDEPEP